MNPQLWFAPSHLLNAVANSFHFWNEYFSTTFDCFHLIGRAARLKKSLTRDYNVDLGESARDLIPSLIIL